MPNLVKRILCLLLPRGYHASGQRAVLYRGQRERTRRLLSPLARADPAASEKLAARMFRLGLCPADIAGLVVRWHDHPVPPIAAPPGLAGLALGAVGITASSSMTTTGYFAQGGLVYRCHVPADLAIRPRGCLGLDLEQDAVVLHEIPAASIVSRIPSRKVPSLMVDELGALQPGP